MPANRKAQIERINQVSAMARTSWIALLGYLAFIGVTLLGVDDADFFVPSRQTQLPLVNVSIPTASFFIFAPVLAAALYIYLHIILLKLWDAIADLTEPTIDDQPVGDALVPWLVNDWALTIRGGAFVPARPLRALGNFASFLLIWAAVPLALFFFWLWSMPAHRPLLSLLLAGCFLLTLAAGITGWRTAHAWLAGDRSRPAEHPSHWTPRALLGLLLTRHPARLRAGAAALGDSFRRHAIIWALGAALAYVTLVRTAWPTEDNPPLARADVSGVEMVALPDGWRDWRTARTVFRETWCRREGMEMAVCGRPADPDLALPEQTVHDRGEWCRKQGIHDGPPCDQAFADLNSLFDEDWRSERQSAIADLPQLDLRGRDLRRIRGHGVIVVGANLALARLEAANLELARLEGANLFGTRLAGANLFGALLEGANLRGAQLQVTNLGEARLEGADLREAQLKGANLGEARLEGADLREAQLEGANLRRARLEGVRLEGANLGDARLEGARLEEAKLDGARLTRANLWGARLERAKLGVTRLEGANLRRARLEGASLRGARLEGANLHAADFRSSNWAGASSRASSARFADFRGAQGLTQAQLDNLIGNAETLLPSMPDGVEPLYMWSCWDTPPEGFDALVAGISKHEGKYVEAIRADFLCGPDNPRRKTGTPLALDAPYPEGHPLANNAQIGQE